MSAMLATLLPSEVIALSPYDVLRLRGLQEYRRASDRSLYDSARVDFEVYR